MATYGISSYGASTGISSSEIKNLALFELGFVDEIDFTDLTNETVKKVNRIYSTTLLYVLSNYPWRFILKRAELTDRSNATDSNKYQYNYVTPVNMLTIRTLYYDADYSSPIKEYETYPKFINTDATRAFIWYSSIVDEDEFPTYFVDYFKYKLAVDLCFNLTGDNNLLGNLFKMEQAMLISAKNIDAKQNKTRIIRSSPFLAIRG
jgi:hypothetical protein